MISPKFLSRCLPSSWLTRLPNLSLIVSFNTQPRRLMFEDCNFSVNISNIGIYFAVSIVFVNFKNKYLISKFPYYSAKNSEYDKIFVSTSLALLCNVSVSPLQVSYSSSTAPSISFSLLTSHIILTTSGVNETLRST